MNIVELLLDNTEKENTILSLEAFEINFDSKLNTEKKQNLIKNMTASKTYL